MAEQTGIEWTDATFNPWIGCQKVSPACDNCYAEALMDKRMGKVSWGPGNPRQRTSEANWKKPLGWQRQADAFEAEHGRSRFVFCASLADVFDNAVDPKWRADLWDLIRQCDRLVWLLLTKRPQNIAKMLPDDWGEGWSHVWLGTTVEDQNRARINVPALLEVPAAKRFLSCEPLLGPINLLEFFWEPTGKFRTNPNTEKQQYETVSKNMLHWVIAGGESGPNARPSHPDWFRSLRDQCDQAGVPFHFKQWGAWLPWTDAVPPEWCAQNGESADGNTLFPDDFDTDPNWDDGIGYIEADEHFAFQRVGKARTGRILDGETHDGRPSPERDPSRAEAGDQTQKGGAA